jgi:aspartyl-tRNA(Asn)/glutamyl-tRNA(Gln) amidotransferase subunit C
MDLGTIRHVAALAELSLTEEEEARMASEIGRIVAYVKELEAIDTTDVPPTAHVSGDAQPRSGDGWRRDQPVAGLSHDDALSGAPKSDHGGFVVPTFVGS